MFFDPSKVESIKETMGLYFYHDLHKRLSLHLINFRFVLESNSLIMHK
jgi:hypothetical protein